MNQETKKKLIYGQEKTVIDKEDENFSNSSDSNDKENMEVLEKENANHTKDFSEIENTLNDTDALANEFFPPELIKEEKRLMVKHKDIDDNVLVEDLDEQSRKEKYEKLLTLLANSSKITNVMESRLQYCKQQIITTELENSEKLNGNTSKNEENSSKDTDEDENYLSLFKQPQLFQGHLKTHQIDGLLWIRTLYENGLNGILADDMGLGKTIQTIAFYCFLLEKKVDGPFLVIAPLSTIPNWLSEFAKFAPMIPTVLYHGTADERNKLQSKFRQKFKVNDFYCYPVIITTYEVIRYDIKSLNNISWKYITIDEGHKLKNINTAISKCMRTFECGNKLILTGTPIQNDMSELWSLLNLIMPNMFKTLEDFNSWFVIDNFFHSNDEIANMAKKDEILDIILKILKPFLLRREKSDTDLILPPKKEIVIYAPITEEQHSLYKATLNRTMEILLNKKMEEDNVIYGQRPKRKCVEAIEKYTDLVAIKTEKKIEVPEPTNMAISVIMQNPFVQLKKIANHPYLVHMPLIPNTNQILVNEDIIKVSGKFQVLEAMLIKLKLRGHKILLFSTMTQILDVIEEFLIYRSYVYARLDGTMRIQDRVDAISKFNSKDCTIMIISTRAGGLGLNLTAADTVIIFDSDWNPQCDLQAQDRCHRMGQDKPVVVYRLCSKNTVDEKILERACAKRKLEKLIMGCGTFNKSSLPKLNLVTIEELMNLLESSGYTKTIQSNGLIFTDEELDHLLDRSDMIETKSESKNTTRSAEHFKVISTS